MFMMMKEDTTQRLWLTDVFLKAPGHTPAKHNDKWSFSCKDKNCYGQLVGFGLIMRFVYMRFVYILILTF